jgi:hypothetical protein
MASNMNKTSVTIDEVAPWRRPTEVPGIGLEKKRIEILRVDRMRRGR